jgi:SAM-dependent methyltransferase
VKKGYEDHLKGKDPNSVEAAHWVGRDKTWLRFKVLTEVGALDGMRVLDYGCGNALLLDFLKEKKIECEYTGWDVSDEAVRVARSRHPSAQFRTADLSSQRLEEFRNDFDYVFVSGVFYIRFGAAIEVHQAWCRDMMLKLWPICKRGMSVNFLTEFTDWRDDDLYYSPLGDTAQFVARNITRRFAIRHDYPLWEFTVYMYRESAEA